MLFRLLYQPSYISMSITRYTIGYFSYLNSKHQLKHTHLLNLNIKQW